MEDSNSKNFENIKKKTIEYLGSVADGSLMKFDKLEDVSIGSKAFGYINKFGFKYQKDLRFTIYKYTKNGKEWLIRFDKAHKGCETEHININPTQFGGNDPHIPLPNGSLFVSRYYLVSLPLKSQFNFLI
jgi:hypothetical protein